MTEDQEFLTMCIPNIKAEASNKWGWCVYTLRRRPHPDDVSTITSYYIFYWEWFAFVYFYAQSSFYYMVWRFFPELKQNRLCFQVRFASLTVMLVSRSRINGAFWHLGKWSGFFAVTPRSQLTLLRQVQKRMQRIFKYTLQYDFCKTCFEFRQQP